MGRSETFWLCSRSCICRAGHYQALSVDTFCERWAQGRLSWVEVKHWVEVSLLRKLRGLNSRWCRNNETWRLGHRQSGCQLIQAKEAVMARWKGGKGKHYFCSETSHCWPECFLSASQLTDLHLTLVCHKKFVRNGFFESWLFLNQSVLC